MVSTNRFLAIRSSVRLYRAGLDPVARRQRPREGLGGDVFRKGVVA